MQATDNKINILYLCTGNSCRSQMAEVYTNALKGDTFTAYSAGVKAQDRVDPLAIEVLQEDPDLEDRFDPSSLRPKTIDALQGVTFDAGVGVCDSAAQSCPIIPGIQKLIRHTFDDPPHLTREMNREEALKVYRRVRDEIKQFVLSLPQGLNQTPKEATV